MANTQGGHLLCDVSILRIDTCKKRIAVADPNLQIRGGGRSYRLRDKGGGGHQKIFLPPQASVWPKNKGGPAPPLDLPLHWQSIPKKLFSYTIDDCAPDITAELALPMSILEGKKLAASSYLNFPLPRVTSTSGCRTPSVSHRLDVLK